MLLIEGPIALLRGVCPFRWCEYLSGYQGDINECKPGRRSTQSALPIGAHRLQHTTASGSSHILFFLPSTTFPQVPPHLPTHFKANSYRASACDPAEATLPRSSTPPPAPKPLCSLIETLTRVSIRSRVHGACHSLHSA